MDPPLSTFLWFSPEQENAIVVTERVASTVSIVSSIFVVLTFASSRRFRKPVNRILFYATIGNLCMNAGTMMAFAGIYQGTDSALCQTQGFLIQMFLPADALWNLSMAINTYLTVFKNYDSKRLRSLETTYNLVNYGLPFIVALTYCFVTTASRGKMYGPAILWCWVGAKWDVFRVALCYAPAWIAILSSFCIYLAAGLHIYRKRNQLRSFRKPSTRQSKGFGSSGMRLPGMVPETINKTTEVRTISEPRDGQSEEEEIFHMEYHCTAEALPQNPFSDHVQLRTTSNPASEANAAAWGYTRAAMLFFVSLMITWVPSSVFRVFSVVHPDIHNYALAFTAALVLPLQGLWNAVIYIITSWDAVKAWYLEDVLCRRPKQASAAGWVDMDRRLTYTGPDSSASSPKRTVPSRHVHDSQVDILGGTASSTRSSILLSPFVAGRPSTMVQPGRDSLTNAEKRSLGKSLG